MLSGILFGSEAWYGVTKQQIQLLETADLHYFKKLFGAHCHTAKEAFYLETGKLPIKFLIMKRRLMYWRHIINSNSDGLLLKFYKIQKACPVRNDWVSQIEMDKTEINLQLTDEEVIGLSKWKFKKLL